MKYMLMIHQGTTPLPGTPEWDSLSESERQAVYADYQAVNTTPGVTPGAWLESPEVATTVRVQPDWPQIAALYGELASLTGSPVVELNRAAAMAEAGEVAPALALAERLELDRYHYLHATRAELLRRLDRVDEARDAYARALELVHSDAERRFLERRLAELQG
jgi:RNA polymerase sigma-70 factor (ECF subfamily)